MKNLVDMLNNKKFSIVVIVLLIVCLINLSLICLKIFNQTNIDKNNSNAERYVSLVEEVNSAIKLTYKTDNSQIDFSKYESLNSDFVFKSKELVLGLKNRKIDDNNKIIIDLNRDLKYLESYYN